VHTFIHSFGDALAWRKGEKNQQIIRASFVRKKKRNNIGEGRGTTES